MNTYLVQGQEGLDVNNKCSQGARRARDQSEEGTSLHINKEHEKILTAQQLGVFPNINAQSEMPNQLITENQ